MAGLVAQWFRSAVIHKLTNFVIAAVQEKYHQLETTKKLLDKLNLNLPLVRELVDVAASRPAIDPALSDWLKQLKDVIYEADDLVDLIEYEKLRLKVSTSAFRPVDSVKNFLSSDPCVTSLRNVVEKLEEIANRAVCFIEIIKLDDVKNKNAINEGTESTSLINEDEKDIFCGRDVEKDTILDMLLNSSPRKKQKTESSSSSNSSRNIGKELFVLPIVGIGGVGKTTLAKVIYNDPAVQDNFHLKAWVYVDHSYDMRKILYEIINLFASVVDVNAFDSLEKITSRLIKITAFESFILVLDDVSEQFFRQWETIGNALRQGKNGSAVLVTTQSLNVAKVISSTGVQINLDVLNETDYWRLFKHHALGDKNRSVTTSWFLQEGKRRVLKDIGREISKKLNGLPLTARVLGRLLITNLDEEFWLKVSRSEWWQNNEVVDCILPSLGLSYQYLNRNQKQCFAYCSLFPKNHVFEKHQVVQMWIAQGYIQPSENEIIEETGYECFEELTRRSFFLHAWDHKYIMHDLMLDLAKYVSRDECFVMEDESAVPSYKFHHLTIKTDGSPKVAQIISKCYMLRSLLVFGDWSNFPCEETLGVIFKELKSLRVLDLSCAFPRGLNLPSAIGDLLHIRYLDMRGNCIISLPHSTCKLFHLQVLNFDGCHTKSLPNDITNLISLRHLYADDKIMDMISNIGKLSNLQKLPRFNVLKEEGHRIIELKEINQLHGSLFISGFENVHSKDEALSAKLQEKEYLRSLQIHKDISKSQIDREIFEGLQPHPNLTNLKMDGYFGLTFPSWMSDIHNLSNLQTINLINCINLQSLPPLGELPYLKLLVLDLLRAITHVGDEFYGNRNECFPCLEYFRLSNLGNLSQWENCSESHRKAYFSRLSELGIYSCYKLYKLHNLSLFSSLKILRVQECWNLDNCALEGINNSLTGLRTLYIHNISKAVTSLCLSKLTELQDLSLRGCPQLSSLDGLQCLVNLKRITILRCPMVASSSPFNDIHAQPGLSSVTYLTADGSVFMGNGSVLIESLPSLQTLNIENIDNDLFSAEQESWFEQFFSLRVLQFEDCPNLLRLPVSLENLPLMKLTINDCPSIGSLPENILPLSLKVLEFENCPKMLWLPLSLVNLQLVELTISLCQSIESLPESGFPFSLQDLHIYGCPKLQARCQKETGPDWHLISHIPFIEVRSSRPLYVIASIFASFPV